jgi:valine--pyruvate aminotransferase
MSGHHFFPGLEEPWRHRDECLRLSYSQDEEVVEAGMRIIGKEIRELYSLAG